MGVAPTGLPSVPVMRVFGRALAVGAVAAAVGAITLTPARALPIGERTSPPSTAAPAAPAARTVDRTRLPLGDGRFATVGSQVRGALVACQTSFTSGAGGAFRDGPWIHEDGTWDLTSKATVDGSVTWAGTFTIAKTGATRTLTGNGVPTSYPTGTFPVVPTDDAFQYDRNPNTIATQTVRVQLPATPSLAGLPSCVPMGVIGVSTSGVAIFNALDALGRDAVAHEIQDGCEGHPERTGQYHHHSITSCIADPGTGHSRLVGYALDGFGIYGHRGANGVELTDADLDACHGHMHAITWDGKTVLMYHYHATWEYPYTVGCFRGTPVEVPRSRGQALGGRPGGPPPPAP